MPFKVAKKKAMAALVALLLLGYFVYYHVYWKTMEVSAYQYGFDPDPIVVEKGDRVRLVVRSEDVLHGVEIAEFNARDDFIPPGKPHVIKFVADKQGIFPVVCSVYCGERHDDMVGTLIVE